MSRGIHLFYGKIPKTAYAECFLQMKPSNATRPAQYPTVFKFPSNSSSDNCGAVYLYVDSYKINYLLFYPPDLFSIVFSCSTALILNPDVPNILHDRRFYVLDSNSL